MNDTRLLKYIRQILLAVISLMNSACNADVVGSGTLKVNYFFDDKKIIELSKHIAKGNISKIEEAVNSGVNINTVGKDGMTLLLLALHAQNKKGYEKLLKLGASPNLQLKSGDSVMSLSAAMSDSFYLQQALMHGGNPNIVNEVKKVFPTPIYRAIAELNINNVKILANANANIDYSDFRGFTPALYAANINQWEIVYFLLKVGADFTKLDRWNKGIVYSLEENNISNQGELYQWRGKVIEFLRQKGVQITPRIP